MKPIRRYVLLCLALFASQAAADAPISFQRQIAPILRQNCIACHNPEKTKGRLDLTSHKTLLAGGETAKAVIPGHPESSLIVKQISGPKPEMPNKGEPLTEAQVRLIAQWITQGAVDDTPAMASAIPPPPTTAPTYAAAPAISALAVAPDGSVLAVAGYHEVLLHNADGSRLLGRLLCSMPRIEALIFTRDSRTLVVAGGAAGEYGMIQVWSIPAKKLLRTFMIGRDTLLGLAFSPDESKLAFGCPDKTARVIAFDTGAELLRFTQHTDWVLGAVFTLDGSQLVSAGRDKAMKLTALSPADPAGRYIDDINNPTEPILSIARHPTTNVAVCGSTHGAIRAWKMAENPKHVEGNNDVNRIREYERVNGNAYVVAYSGDGMLLAAGGQNEAKVFNSAGGNRVATLGNHGGAVYAVAFSPDGKRLYTGCQDGQVRIFELAGNGKPLKSFVPVPVAGN